MITHNVNYFIISGTFLSAPLTFWLAVWNWSIVFDSDTMFCFQVMLKVYSKRQDSAQVLFKRWILSIQFLNRKDWPERCSQDRGFPARWRKLYSGAEFLHFLFSYIFYIFTFIYVLFKSKLYFPKALKSIHPYLPSQDIPWISDGSGMNAVQGLRMSRNLFLATYTGQILGK